MSETGCLDPNDPRQPAAGVIPYEPTARLWSDGAWKARFFAIPDGTFIDIDDDGDFLFPEGTVLIKHFGYDLSLHETRLFIHHPDGWAGYTYGWNAAQSDAVLLESATNITLENGIRWQYPSRSQCLNCHNDSAGDSLGLEAIQFVRPLDYGGADGPEEQLTWFIEHELVEPSNTRDSILDGLTPLPDPWGDASITDRARSYLHGNCSMCHRPGGPGRGDIDLRAYTPFADTRLCEEEEEGLALWDARKLRQSASVAPRSTRTIHHLSADGPPGPVPHAALSHRSRRYPRRTLDRRLDRITQRLPLRRSPVH